MGADAVTFNVSGGSGTSVIHNAGGKDAYVNIIGKITSRLIIRSARNVRLIGGEIDIATAWANANERWGLYFQDCTGILHVEGLFIHGSALIEGIDLGQVSPGQPTSPYPQVLQVQNCRIVDLADPSGAYHADAIQCWGGTRALRIDKCTLESQFQNLMFKCEANTFESISIQRCDMRGKGTQQAFQLNTAIGGTNAAGNPVCSGPVVFGDGVYVTRPSSSKWGFDFGHADFGRVATPTYQFAGSAQVAATERPALANEGGRNYLHWPTSAQPYISGRVWEGPRPEGDWCPIGVAGMAYKTPGYQS